MEKVLGELRSSSPGKVQERTKKKRRPPKEGLFLPNAERQCTIISFACNKRRNYLATSDIRQQEDDFEKIRIISDIAPMELISKDVRRPLRYAVCLLFLLFPSWGSAEEGIASWYGGKFHGRTTASGEVFNTYSMTAAHRSLPFQTVVRVTNLDNGKVTVVRITDRGPFIKGRIIDLSFAAAKKIDMVRPGTARVRLTILSSTDHSEVRYKVQVASFRNKKSASSLKKRLNKRGIPAQLFRNVERGVTRVQIRKISSSQLSQILNSLRRLGYKGMVSKE